MPPTEEELRAMLRGDGSSPAIDVDAVLRRSRRRRRPRVALAAAGSVLAVAAVVVPVSVSAFAPQQQTMFATTSGSAGDAAAPESASGLADDSDADGIKRAPADRLNLCSGPLAEVAPAVNGLVLEVAPVEASADARAIPATVTLTNTGDARVTGTTASAPALTLSRDGITLWHSNGPVDLMAIVVDLEPGESLQYQTSFEPVVCGVDDDLAESFPADLPAAGAGGYGLSAAIDLVSDEAGAELITGPVATVTLR